MSEPGHLQSSSPGTGAVLGQAGCSTSKPAGWWFTLGRGHFLRRAATEPLARCRLHLQGWLLYFFAFVSSWSWCASDSSLPSFYSCSCSLWEGSVFLTVLIRNLLFVPAREHFIESLSPTVSALLSPRFASFHTLLGFPLPWSTGRGQGNLQESSGGTGLKGALPHIRKGAGQRRK